MSRGSLLLAAEVALLATTLTALAGLGRLLEDGSFLAPVLTFGLLGHAVAALCRRRGLGVAATGVVAAVGLGLAVTWILLPQTAAAGLPTGETLTEAGERLRSAVETFRQVVAPAPVEPGFVLASGIAAWLVAVTADTAAFRAGAPVEAAMPAAAVFVFGAALGAPGHRVAATVAFLLATLAFWLAHRALRQAQSPTWMGAVAAGAASLARRGAALAVGAAVVAAVLGPSLPGADADPILPWRSSEQDDGGQRVTISPLVDIRSRLVDQHDVELFTVAADARAYWRLTSLERFDGRIWSSRGRYRSADADLSPAVPGAGQQGAVTQSFEIGPLATIWLPAAYRPTRVDGIEASWDPGTGSLIPTATDATAQGRRYTVVSAITALGADRLAQASPAIADDVADVHLELPATVSPAVREEAARVVSGAATAYDAALALQNHFRDGRFTYSLDVPPGHGGADLDRFLFETRAGYCEQFAGAYAAMARAVGLPARVAVGFTPGEPGADGRLHVKGLHAHAWPEVYFHELGWVAFEPTPGRGIPGGQSWTGLPEQQASPEDPTAATTLPTTTVVPAPAAGAPTTTVAAPGSAAPAPGGQQPERGWWSRNATWVIGMVAVAGPLLWLGIIAVGHRIRRSRRRARAATPAQRVLVAWDEVAEALADAGLAPRPEETPAEYARRAAVGAGIDPDRIAHLAAATSAAGFARDGVARPVAADALAAAAALEQQAWRKMGRRNRLRRAVDPRPLLPHLAPRLEVRRSAAPRW